MTLKKDRMGVAMNQTDRLKNDLKALCVYDIADDPVIQAIASLLEHAGDVSLVAEKWAHLFRTLCNAGYAGSLKGYIADLILTDDNCFTRAAAAGTLSSLNATIIGAARQDLWRLEALAHLTPDTIISSIEDAGIKQLLQGMGKWETGSATVPLSTNWGQQLDQLAQHYRTHGYGSFAKYKAFSWREQGLFPVTSSNPVTIEDLKSYEKQRQKVIDNTESFVMGLPANNVLLYGDRGTGKSSTVHAVLNQFAPLGLRMIEVPKSAIPEFPLLLEQLVNAPMKFIIFIDDLSFNSDDDSYASLKAVLEGSVSAKQSNTLIYATSNRRHLIKESFSSRSGDELHRTDTIQETMSLSDRFGLSVTFLNPDRNRYYEIIDKIIADRGLAVDLKRLHAGAERWALERGGRSPRVAKQYIDLVESRVKRGLDW